MAELRGLDTADYAGGDPNVDAFVQSLQDYLDGKPSSYDPKQGVPAGYKIDNGQVVKQSQWDQWGKGAAIGMGAGIAGGLGAGWLNSLGAGEGAAPALEGLSAGGEGAGAASVPVGATLGPTTAESMAATQAGLVPPASLAAGGSNSMAGGGLLSKLFGGATGTSKGGILDPSTLLLGALSLFGGPQQQYQQSFKNPGQITDPEQSLYQALQGTYRLGAGLEQRNPTKLRSSYVQPGPAPVTVPGVGFQIGGGLGTDPALKDPSLLEGQGSQDVSQYGPFQGIAQDTFNKAGAPQPTKRRTP